MLVKTAIFGGDANWGRILQTIGAARVGVRLARTTVRLGGVVVFRSRRPTAGQAARRPRPPRARGPGGADRGRPRPRPRRRADLHLRISATTTCGSTRSTRLAPAPFESKHRACAERGWLGGRKLRSSELLAADERAVVSAGDARKGLQNRMDAFRIHAEDAFLLRFAPVIPHGHETTRSMPFAVRSSSHWSG